MTVSPLNRDFIAGFQQGSYESVRELYHVYYASLIEFAVQLTGNTDEAHHIVQETFVKLFLMRKQFNNTANVKAFLYLTVRNTCFAFTRSEKQKTVPAGEASLYEQEEDTTDRFGDEHIRQEAIGAIKKEVMQLPEQCRQVFHLIYGKRLPVPDVSEQLGIGQPTVAKKRIKAVRLLRERMFEKGLFSIPLYIYFLAVAYAEH